MYLCLYNAKNQPTNNSKGDMEINIQAISIKAISFHIHAQMSADT